MYSLIKYHNDAFSVVFSNKIDNRDRKNCTVKCNGGKYSAFFISKNDDKSLLLDIKKIKEEQSASSFPKTSSHSKPPRNVLKKTLNKTKEQRTTSVTNSSSCNLNSAKHNITPKNTPSTQTFSLGEQLPSKIKSSLICSNSSCDKSTPSKHIEEKFLSTINNTSQTNLILSPHKPPSDNKALPNLKSNIITSFEHEISSLPILNNEAVPVFKNKNSTMSSKKTIVTEPLLTSISPPKLKSQCRNSLMILSKSDGNCLVPFSEKLITIDQIHKTENITKELTISYVYPLETLPIESEHSNNKNSPNSNADSNCTEPFFENFMESIAADEEVTSFLELSTNQLMESIAADEEVTSFLEPSTNLLSDIIVNTKFNMSQQSDISLNCIYDDSNENVMSSDTTLNDLYNTKHNSTSLLSTEICFEKVNCTDISSIQVQESSASEYFPNSTAETITDIGNKSTPKSLPVNETSIEVIQNPLNIAPLTVPYASNKSKQHFCIFCKTLQCKLPRHFFLKHKNEKQMKMAFGLPKNSKERLKILDELRKKGDFLHNTSEDLNSGILIVSRQQQKKSKNNVDDYACCKLCHGFFSKQTLRIHLSKCGGKKNERCNLIDGRRLTQYIHSAANELLKTKIFPVLRNDEISKSIRYDELVIKFGNKLSEKYSSPHQHDMIRASLRLLGRFKIEINKLDPDIIYLNQIYKPCYFDICITALRTVSNWDSNQMWFKTPAVAQSLTSLIKKCGKKQRAEFIKSDCEDLKKDLDNFLILWEEEVPTLIHKKALEDQTNQKRIKKVVLPSKEDIKKLYTYLKNKMLNSLEKLSKSFHHLSWTELVQSTLIFIQIFNRRRAGEIERLTIDNYCNKENITDNIEKDILENVSEESIVFAKQYVRITLRGKLGRTVSVLLSPISIKAIDLILKFRTNAGIPKENQFIFSKPGTSKLSKQYYRACPLLRKFSEECGAQIPESLRGTMLRKHIATYTSLLNIEEAAVDRLANFMGHHKDIHKNIYRMSIPIAEITCVSKILMTAIGDEKEDEDDDDDELVAADDTHTIEKEIVDIYEENGKQDLNDKGDHIEEDKSDDEEDWLTERKNLSSSRKRRSTSPFGKTKRCRWTNEERDAICSMFGNLKDLEKLPSLAQCQSATHKYSILKKRTPQQIKTWIDNQRRYK